MRLNTVSPALIVESAILARELKNVNPLAGQGISVSEDSFKFKFNNRGLDESLLIEKADLDELFKGIPQSIVGLSFKTLLITDFSDLEKNLDIDTSREEYPVYNSSEELSETDNVFTDSFNRWTALVGIRDLYRNEVSLSISENYLVIECRNATYYKGSVRVKIKEEEVSDEPVL